VLSAISIEAALLLSTKDGACHRPPAGDAMPRSLSSSAALRSDIPAASAARMLQSRDFRHDANFVNVWSVEGAQVGGTPYLRQMPRNRLALSWV
jgi:hypothetical protein